MLVIKLIGLGTLLGGVTAVLVIPTYYLVKLIVEGLCSPESISQGLPPPAEEHSD